MIGVARRAEPRKGPVEMHPFNRRLTPLARHYNTIMTRYLIGIDLGTTNLAYFDLATGKSNVHSFSLPQLV